MNDESMLVQQLDAETQYSSMLRDENEHLKAQIERMRTFMEMVPSAECFTTRNVLAVYEAWADMGIV